MYTTPVLSLLVSLLIYAPHIAASTSTRDITVETPLADQLPLIARVGQPYSWSISPNTFSSPDVHATTLPQWLTYANYTFTGTPTAADEGSTDVVLASGSGGDQAQDEFTLCVTHFQQPVLHIPLASQFLATNPSMSSVFFVGNGSALIQASSSSANSVPQPPIVRIPPHWSFSIGFAWNTFLPSGSGNVYYAARQADGSALPGWMIFSPDSMTLNGVSKVPEGTSLDLLLIASDKEGYSAVSAAFNVLIAAHELSTSAFGLSDGGNGVGGGILPINVTAGDPFSFNFQQNDWVLGGVKLDGASIRFANLTQLAIDTSSYPWLSYSIADATLSGTAPSTAPSTYYLPVILSAQGQSLSMNLTVADMPAYWSTETLPDAFAPPETTFSYSLSDYLSKSQSVYAGHAIEVTASFSPNNTVNFLSLTDNAIKGTIPGNPPTHANVTLTAYDHTSHTSSHTSLLVTFKMGPNSTLSYNASLERRRKLVLGLSIGLGTAVGLVVLAGCMATGRKIWRVKDTAVDEYAEEEKAKGIAEEDEGYGWTEKFGLGSLRVGSPFRSPYPGLGIGFTPSSPVSPSKTTKGAFFQNVKRKISGAISIRSAVRKVSASGTAFVANAVRKVSTSSNRSGSSGTSSVRRMRDSVVGFGRSIRNATRKSAISRPVLLFTRPGGPSSEESMRALSRAAGIASPNPAGYRPHPQLSPSQVYATAGARMLNPDVQFHDPARSESVNVHEGDGLSVGFGSTTASPGSPNSASGCNSTETGASATTVPRQRADFGPARSGVRAPAPVVIRNGSGRDRRRSIVDTDLEEAVIVTASRSRAPSGHSEYSSYPHDNAMVARPKLVQFTSARGVPQPLPGLSAYNGAQAGADARRTSQVADVVSPTAHDEETDALLSEGMRYVRAFGHQNEQLEPHCPPNLGNQSPAPGPAPSKRINRSNSRRSSVSGSRGRLSPAGTVMTSTTGGTGGTGGTGSSGSPLPTQSSYVYPSPSQSTLESQALHRSNSRGTGVTSTSRGSLVMSRILVRAGEDFVFKYPVVVPPSSAMPRKLQARMLYGGAKLPEFLSYSASQVTQSPSPSGKGKKPMKERERHEVEFWGTPRAVDVGEVVVGIFAEAEQGGEREACVGRLVVEVVARG